MMIRMLVRVRSSLMLSWLSVAFDGGPACGGVNADGVGRGGVGAEGGRSG